jgi:hypothetical protein
VFILKRVKVTGFVAALQVLNIRDLQGSQLGSSRRSPGKLVLRPKGVKNKKSSRVDRSGSVVFPCWLAEAVFVDGHAHSGVHADLFQGSDFAACFDSAGGNDGVRRGVAELSKPF